MDSPANAKCDPPPVLIAGRYRVEKILGQGGMAVVYQVHDIQTGKTLALKQLLVREDSRKKKEIAELFEYEYLTLVQLAHPSVIEVYNFGKDDTEPYYTMEILVGGDLRQHSPMPWKAACSILIEVCSALGLLHSRGLLHRDISPRNIHCTQDDKAKLIDFGTMAPMGPSRRVAGTPSFTSPESLALQNLDARSDIYSLGTTFYYALTGRYAYFAKSFSQARELWRKKPLPPSHCIPNIPKELDHLVLSMLSLDPVARPMNTAVVMERLSAIAGIELDDRQLVSLAYLTTPSLVGHRERILRFKKQMARASNGYGSTVFIEGTIGAGRSRFLDACVLEGQIFGAVVLRADASDAYTGDWGVVQTIASQLLDALPHRALKAAEPYLSVLDHIIPELLNRFEEESEQPLSPIVTSETSSPIKKYQPDFSRVERRSFGEDSERSPQNRNRSSLELQSFDNPQELRPHVQKALRDWFLEVGSHHCLLLAVDDIHRIDEPSAAFIALLTQEISRKKITIAVTRESHVLATSDTAMKLLKESSHCIKLPNLNLEHTEELLGSMFGETTNLRLITDRIYKLSHGNPRSVMLLAQHLVDKELVRYRAGAWTLPNAIDDTDLPNRLSEALKTRLKKLDLETLALAQTMSLSPEQRFSSDDCLILTEHRQKARLLQHLDQLVATRIVSTDGLYYSFIQKGWVSVLADQIAEGTKRAFHLRLAEMFEARGTDSFRVATQLLNAGETERALDEFINFSETSRRLTNQNPQAYSDLVQSLPEDWYNILLNAIHLAKQSGRPRKQIYKMQIRIGGLNAFKGRGDTVHLTDLIEQLVKYSGLSFYREMPNLLKEEKRLERALQLAQQSFERYPESERVLSPQEALSDLVKTLIETVGVLYRTNDYSILQSLPSLYPFTPLSIALGVVEKLLQSTEHGISGRLELARQLNWEILERIKQPDRAGLQETHQQYMRYGVMHALGMQEASMGLESALTLASEIETSPLLRVDAQRIRMLYYLWQGNTQEAEKCKIRTELLKIQNSYSQAFSGSHLFPELLAYCLSDDLLGIRQTLDSIEEMAQQNHGWLLTLRYAQGEYQRIRGDCFSALALLQEALSMTRPGRYRNWVDLAGALVKTLFAIGDYKRARKEGHRWLKSAIEERVGYCGNYLRMPLSLVEAKQQDFQNAVKLSESVIESFRSLGATGLNLGLAYETRARVAIMMADQQGLEIYSKLCAEQYRTGHNPALTAKYEILMQEADEAKLRVSEPLDLKANWDDINNESLIGEITVLVDGSRASRARAERILELLVKKSNSIGGYLYFIQNRLPKLKAQKGNWQIPVGLDERVKGYLAREIEGTKAIDSDARRKEIISSTDSDWTFSASERYRPLLLGHHTQIGFAVSGVAVLRINDTDLFKFPTSILAVVSKVLVDAGDVSLIYAAGSTRS